MEKVLTATEITSDGGRVEYLTIRLRRITQRIAMVSLTRATITTKVPTKILSTICIVPENHSHSRLGPCIHIRQQRAPTTTVLTLRILTTTAWRSQTMSP